MANYLSEYINTVLNSLDKNNLAETAKTLAQSFGHFPDHRKPFAKQLITKRVISESNNLEMYADFVKLVNDAQFDEDLLNVLIPACHQLLNTPTVTTDTKPALRNLGMFMGLITITRDKGINKDLIDFELLLKSENDTRLNLAVVLVTHVFKFCYRSTKFNKECTWISHIIDILKTIHSKETTKLQTSLEIERFFEYLENKGVDESENDKYALPEFVHAIPKTPQRHMLHSTPQNVQSPYTPQSVHTAYAQPRMPSTPSAMFSTPSKMQANDESLLKDIIHHLDFSGAPIFSLFNDACEKVAYSFSKIMHNIESSFFENNMLNLSAICESTLLRDMAFCTDEQQIHLAYQRAIRVYVLAMLQPRSSIQRIIRDLQSILKHLFLQIIKTDSSQIWSHTEVNANDQFVAENVMKFMEKNHMIIADSLCALFDRRAEHLANQSATRTLNERRAVMLSGQSRELKRFIGETHSIQDINSRLPAMLCRVNGALSEKDMEIYMDFDEFADTFHKYFEEYGLSGKSEGQKIKRALNQIGESSDSDEILPIKLFDNLRQYVEMLYKKNPIEAPDFFYEYIGLVMQDSFLSRLKKIDVSLAHNSLMLLVLPVIRMLLMLAKKGELTNAMPKFGNALTTFFDLLTREFPEAFDIHYLDCSETLPEMMLMYRNLIMSCKPYAVELPSIETDLKVLCDLPEMNANPNIDIEAVCTLSESLKNVIVCRMTDEHSVDFPDELIKAFKSKSSVAGQAVMGTNYDRHVMLHTIVYIAHCSIKAIGDTLSTINRDSLGEHAGQKMLMELINAMDNKGRYILLFLMADQLRYPCSMTCYFVCFLLNLFLTTTNPEIREMLCRVILERFLPSSRYPWGLCLIMHELLRNPIYKFKSYDYTYCFVQIETLIKKIEANVHLWALL